MDISMTLVRLRRAATALLATLGIAAVLLLASMGTAQAGTPYTHNNYYTYAGLYAGNQGTGGVIWNEYNNQSVTMLCYSDGANVTDRNYSNYNSPRWYRIRDAGGRVGYIHSSYVFSQTTVGTC